ncbi:MAG: trehalose-6-phosphate synthase, partial [Gammaproteobacteria bacterium]
MQLPRTLSLSLRFVLPLAVALFAMALLVMPLIDALTLKWSVRDVEIRAELVGDTLQELIAAPLAAGDLATIHDRFERSLRDERLYALALCTPDDRMIVRTDTWPDSVDCNTPEGQGGTARGLIDGDLHVAVKP